MNMIYIVLYFIVIFIEFLIHKYILILCLSIPCLSYNHCFRFLLVCLFVWSLASNSWIFKPYGNFTIASEGLQTLTYARHSWSFSSEENYFDTGLHFIMVISEDPWLHTCCRAFDSWAFTACFYDLGLSRPGIEPRTPACKASAQPLHPCGG